MTPTYESAWQWNSDHTGKQMTAEEWLIEEAQVEDAVAGKECEDGPNRPDILRAIAREIATLRAEVVQLRIRPAVHTEGDADT